MNATLTAHVARQPWQRTEIIHAVADQPVTISHAGTLCPVTRPAGEPLCGTGAPLGPAGRGLFPPEVTCRSCARIAERENVQIGEPG
ncbi:MAG: hypothetical protein ACYCO9_06385 [Streptosporangiaceae bacterium]